MLLSSPGTHVPFLPAKAAHSTVIEHAMWFGTENIRRKKAGNIFQGKVTHWSVFTLGSLSIPSRRHALFLQQSASASIRPGREKTLWAVFDKLLRDPD
ncbi:hypothetical protein [Noviherbaspirillum aerium]|uniref:hypothetical protein n=1 Tax=Noviherbaspirillum aerium TaxID=2588497 RepID=UPI00124DFE41|nr:hypothetical protein [Noviherbaspirillum aerium]